MKFSHPSISHSFLYKEFTKAFFFADKDRLWFFSSLANSLFNHVRVQLINLCILILRKMTEILRAMLR